MAQENIKPGNPDLLRKDIDRGKTADKVGFPDPAAAPLGTDDEAGGTPSSPAAVAEARSQERSFVPDTPRDARSGVSWGTFAAALIAFAGIAMIYAYMF